MDGLFDPVRSMDPIKYVFMDSETCSAISLFCLRKIRLRTVPVPSSSNFSSYGFAWIAMQG